MMLALFSYVCWCGAIILRHGVCKRRVLLYESMYASDACYGVMYVSAVCYGMMHVSDMIWLCRWCMLWYDACQQCMLRFNVCQCYHMVRPMSVMRDIIVCRSVMRAMVWCNPEMRRPTMVWYLMVWSELRHYVHNSAAYLMFLLCFYMYVKCGPVNLLVWKCLNINIMHNPHHHHHNHH